MPAARQPQQPTQQWQAQGAPPPAPPSSRKTAIIIIVILLVLGLCTRAAGAGWFYYVSQAADVLETVQEPTATPTAPITPEPPSAPFGFATPEDALLSELPPEWVYLPAADTPEMVEYWAGPPHSEWASVYIVQQSADGSWYIAESGRSFMTWSRKNGSTAPTACSTTSCPPR
jgi:hypothetical protein